MNFQIDVKPKQEGNIHEVHLYIAGNFYKLFASEYEIYNMKKNGLVVQTTGQRYNEKEELEKFDYPEGHDGAGVKYTSKVYKMEEVKYGN